jgi:hypothetical protein
MYKGNCYGELQFKFNSFKTSCLAVFKFYERNIYINKLPERMNRLDLAN